MDRVGRISSHVAAGPVEGYAASKLGVKSDDDAVICCAVFCFFIRILCMDRLLRFYRLCWFLFLTIELDLNIIFFRNRRMGVRLRIISVRLST